MCEATVLAELPMSGFYSGCAWGCCLKGIAIALTSLVFLCIWVRFREVQASKEVYTFMKYCQWPCCAKLGSLLLGFLAGTEILMAEGRSLENQVILGGGSHCSVWGDICKYVWGEGTLSWDVRKQQLFLHLLYLLKWAVLIAILQISCNTINLNLTCISNYFRFIILFFIIHVV